ncbi:MAG: hypothetical protein KatS3mg125_2039 [Lysobacterales bacterium]|nr:MAG: hypothetical protein KatS3mg125_2039 [Xanthomonadales bacterium]
MAKIVVAEASQTRRRALASLFVQQGHSVTALAGADPVYALLRRMHSSLSQCDVLVLGWPEYPDGSVEDVLGLLYGERYEHLPVLLMAEEAKPAVVNWKMTRPRTSVLLWRDFRAAPQAVADLLSPPETQNARSDGEERGTPLSVLLVDDSATVRAAYAKLLARHGFQVDLASSVAEGRERIRARPYDIAIVDYYMPGENGPALLRAMREEPNTRHTLATILTGTYSDTVIAESLAAGAVDCLFKSEAQELFLTRVRSLARTVRDRKAIDAERRQLEGILHSVGDGVYGVDPNGTIRFVNPAALQLLGLGEAKDLIGRDAYATFHNREEDGSIVPRGDCFLCRCYEEGLQVTAHPTVFWTPSGRMIPVECTVYPLVIEGTRTGSVVAFRDVSERKLLEEELRWQAEHDALTQLPNRAAFEQQLAKEIERLKRTHQSSLLLFIDLDRFKYVNDTAGHSAGDEMLKEVGRRLRARLRTSDVLARMGGDEYGVILRNVRLEDVHGLVEGFRRALTGAPFVHGGKSYRITLSIGVTLLDQTTVSPGDAMAQADVACHLAKRSGRDQVRIYEPSSGERAGMERELGWSARLEEALRGDGFDLCFQPIVPLADLPDGATPAQAAEWAANAASGARLFEVLLRYREKSGELVSPHAFLSAAERFGLLRAIDAWVVDRALAMLAERSRERPIALSINLSGESLESEQIAERLAAAIERHRVDPRQITFEINEGHSIRDLAGVERVIAKLRGLGCRIAIDDFGTGFSTFSYIKRLEADFLKIDGSLLDGLPDDRLDRTVISSLVAIATAAGKRTVAECVERPAALAALKACGVDFVQGYAIAPPRLGLPAMRPHLLREGAQRGQPQLG